MTEIKYRANVAGILRNREGKILICERVNVPNAWQFPQGGVDGKETLEEAVQRELWEEISVIPGDYEILECRGPYRYLYGGGRMKRGHHGKEQHYFLCDFHAAESRVNVATEHPEFQAAKWILPAEFRLEWLPEMKVEVYQAVFREFFQVKL